jgi:hypothetical protein
MSQKIYKSARGKTIDFGSLRLQNEHVRAVGNMNVNARGDRIDAEGNVIDARNQQMQRRIQRQSNVSSGPVHSSTRSQTENALRADQMVATGPAPVADIPITPNPITPTTTPVATAGGLAAAIAKSKTIKQELEQNARQRQQSQPLRKF